MDQKSERNLKKRLLAHINQMVEVEVVEPIQINLFDNSILTDLTIKSLTDKGSLILSLTQLQMNAQQSKFDWQLSLNQSKPLVQISSLEK